MAKAKKLPSGNWRICVYIGTDATGKKKFKSITHPDKKTCEFMAAEYQLSFKNSPGALSDLTFAAALDRYIESKSNVLSPTTLREYKVCRRNYFKTLAPMKLQDITQNDIQIEINDLSSRLAPKTVESTRFVEMPQYVIDKIVPGEGNIVELTPDKITHHFARLLRNNGIPHFRFHDLRHYQASILHAMGVPDKYIMQRGGWRTDNTLKNIYQHTFDKTTKEVSNKINDYFTDMIKETQP